MGLLGKVLTKIADFAALGLINKFLGGVFNTIKIAFIISVLFYLKSLELRDGVKYFSIVTHQSSFSEIEEVVIQSRPRLFETISDNMNQPTQSSTAFRIS